MGLASERRVAIEGSSAGGFTALNCLCFSRVFKAGACRYGVTDLVSLSQDTHRFESGYVETLVGAWPAAKHLYAARSPLSHADLIRSPVIFFQGQVDEVVLPDQTERMALALNANNIPCQVHVFPDEGHGFRSSAVLTSVLEATEAFFQQHLELPCP